MTEEVLLDEENDLEGLLGPALAAALAEKGYTTLTPVQEAVLAGLTQQYEQAKIAENQNLPSVQIVSRGLPPPRASRPKLIFNCLIATAVGIVLGPLVAFSINIVRDLHAAIKSAQEP